MSLSRRELARDGTVATAIGPAATDFAKIVAAYRALQIGTNQPSLERNQALAALDQVAHGYDSTMDLTGAQLWPDLPGDTGRSDFFPTMFYRLRTIAVDWATPGSALSAKPCPTAASSNRLILVALRSIATVCSPHSGCSQETSRAAWLVDETSLVVAGRVALWARRLCAACRDFGRGSANIAI